VAHEVVERPEWDELADGVTISGISSAMVDEDVPVLRGGVMMDGLRVRDELMTTCMHL